MLRVRFRFGFAVAYLGDDVTKWTKELFEFRQTSTPSLLVPIQFMDGQKVKAFLRDLVLVED